MRHFFAAYLLLVPSLLAQLSASERCGKEIYMRGVGGSGKEIVALLDNGQTRVPATLTPCGSCHGADGRGKPEGGVVPPDITWDALTKPYGVYRTNGRSHAPYTESTFKRAFTMGTDPSGNKLDTVMPRFQLSYEDAACLVAFMKKLGHLADPGITDESIRIGVLLGPSDTLIRTTLAQYFDKFNRDGGVYGRTVELVFHDREGATRLAQWLNRASVFALIGNDLTGAESDVAPVLNDAETPSIWASAAEPDLRQPLKPYVFYVRVASRPAHTDADSLTAARILTAGLQRAGRSLTRQSFVEALESMYKVDFGGVEVTFGPNRRVGVSQR